MVDGETLWVQSRAEKRQQDEGAASDRLGFYLAAIITEPGDLSTNQMLAGPLPPRHAAGCPGERSTEAGRRT